MNNIKIIDQETVERILTMDVCINAMEEAMIASTNKTVTIPPRLFGPLHDKSGYFGVMPGSSVEPPAFGVKVATVKPENPAQGRPVIQGFVALFDHHTGEPLSIIDAGSITAIRTAATSGMATKHLAREDVKTHLIAGTGVQAPVHAKSILSARPSIKETYIWGRDFNKAEKVAEELSKLLPCKVSAVKDIEEGADSEVISMVTASNEPLLKGKWLSPGTHVNLVGAHAPDAREADTETITRSRVFVDLLESAKNEAGDILIPINEGKFSFDNICGEIGSVVENKIPGRQSHDEITVYKSLGVVSQDIYAAWKVFDLAS